MSRGASGVDLHQRAAGVSVTQNKTCDRTPLVIVLPACYLHSISKCMTSKHACLVWGNDYLVNHSVDGLLLFFAHSVFFVPSQTRKHLKMLS